MSKKLGVFSNFFSKAFSVFTPQTSVRCEELLLSWMESWRAAAKGATRVVKSGFYIAFSPGNFAAILLSNPVTASDLSNSSFYLPSGRLFDIHCCSRFISSGTDEVRAKREPSLCNESVKRHFWHDIIISFFDVSNFSKISTLWKDWDFRFSEDLLTSDLLKILLQNCSSKSCKAQDNSPYQGALVRTNPYLQGAILEKFVEFTETPCCLLLQLS